MQTTKGNWNYTTVITKTTKWESFHNQCRTHKTWLKSQTYPKMFQEIDNLYETIIYNFTNLLPVEISFEFMVRICYMKDIFNHFKRCLSKWSPVDTFQTRKRDQQTWAPVIYSNHVSTLTELGQDPGLLGLLILSSFQFEKWHSAILNETDSIDHWGVNQSTNGACLLVMNPLLLLSEPFK